MLNKSNQMMWISLSIAAIAHVLLITLFKFNYHIQASKPQSVFTVTLRKSAKEVKIINQKSDFLKQSADAISSGSTISIPPKKHAIHTSLNSLEANQLSVKSEQTSVVSSIEKTNYNTSVSILANTSLLEEAKKTAREEARQLEKNDLTTNNTRVSVQNTLSAAIGGAFKRDKLAEQKITQYADGMVEVATAYGTRYCLAPIRSFERGGPIDVQAIPMTCR